MSGAAPPGFYPRTYPPDDERTRLEAPPGFAPPPAQQPETSLAARLSGDQPGAIIPSQTSDQGSLWPIRRTASGPVFDPYAGVLGSLLRGLTAPGDVYTGRVPITGPQGGINPDLVQRGIDAASLINPGNPASLAGERGFGPARAAPPRPPSATALESSADLGFDTLRAQGPDVLSSTIADQARQTSQSLSSRFAPESAKDVYSTLTSMTNPIRSWTSMTDLLARRDALKDIAAKGGGEAKAAREAMIDLDRMISTLDPTNTQPRATIPLRPLDPHEVAPIMEKARGDYGAAQRSNTLTGELNEATTGFVEGAESRRRGNLDLNIRNRATALLKQEKEVQRFAPEERAALKDIRDGGPVRNFASDVGATFGRSGVSKLWSSLAGSTAGGLLGTVISGITPAAGIPAAIGMLATPAIGAAARRVADAGARRAVEAADDLIRSRSPMYQDWLAAGRTSPVLPGAAGQAAQSAVAPGLLRSTLQAPPGVLLGNEYPWDPEEEYRRGRLKPGVTPQGPVI